MDERALISEALKAREKAYVPYSNFKVGAALLHESGDIIHGCNVENASYGATNCAERTSMFRAISEGRKAGTFKSMAIVGDTEGPIAPCGICRQVMIEICGPDMPVILGNTAGVYITTTVKELLPGAFDQTSLK
ncbi:cytidine deaminase [Paenibacillus swuensis]|uniref:Cytidine deaminase n=1 Tax=Paenibacillus swuensis TaxID=1178515 RepID=A0A172TKM6_9BACL|nr:cytidine deaminase [Paenibacillus swuensis]ANE47323.1 cytidine deaminase [Paenibacillus swuensis]